MARLEACPTCSNPTSENATFCPSCGEPLEAGWADKIALDRSFEGQNDESSPERGSGLAIEPKTIIERARADRPVGNGKNALIQWGLFLLPVIGFIGYYQWNIHEVEIQKFINPDGFEARVLELEKEVAKVPSTKFEENIRLYAELVRLKPEKRKYQLKLSTYKRLKAQKEKKEQIEKERKRSEKLAAKAAAKERAEEERRAKGFHCLTSGHVVGETKSPCLVGLPCFHSKVRWYTKKRMRDPDSFKHIETRITSRDQEGNHRLVMTYRAKNGFGGFNIGNVKARIRSADCQATITEFGN